MKAIHKYNRNDKEGARRIAQSYGYKTSVYDSPQLINLLYKAGIELQGVEYNKNKSSIIVDDMAKPHYMQGEVVDTIKL
jgi:hypothetical protein